MDPRRSSPIRSAGRGPILTGVAEANVRETLKACEYAYSLGIRARRDRLSLLLQAQPARRGVPALLPGNPAGTSPIDVTLYNILMFGCSPIDIPFGAAAERVRKIVHQGLLRRAAAHDPDDQDGPGRSDRVLVPTGWDAAHVPMLLVDCDEDNTRACSSWS